MDSKIYTIEWDKVRPETINLLKSKDAQIINGVARNVSDKYQIIQHMPFKEVNVSDISNLSGAIKSVQDMQAVMLGVQAISSVAIMGAIVISTAYLSKKIDKIQETVDLIQKELQSQNLVYYAEKISVFFGVVEATREIIRDQDIISENEDLVVIKLSELATLRNQLFSYLNNLIFISDQFTLEHKSLAIDFTNMTIDLLPKLIFIESQAAYKIERFYLGDNIRNSAKRQYYDLTDNYKEWSNKQYSSIVEGKKDSNTKVFLNKYNDIKALISSEENRYLLEYTV